MRIELVNLKKEYEAVKNKLEQAMRRIFVKSDFIFGEELKPFEEEFEKYCGVKYALGVDSGTGALELAAGN